MLVGVVGLVGVIGGGAVACYATANDDPESAARLERAEQLVAAHCASTQECECSVTNAQSGCEATLAEQWRGRLQAGKTRGLTYDAECFDAIEAGIEDARCGWPPGDDRHPCHDFCQVFHGDRSDGQSCERFDDLVSDCEQGLLCDRGKCVSPCETLSGLAEGEVCRDPVNFTALDRCADGLTCLGNTGRCAKAPPAGSACLAGECDADSYCDYSTGSERCLARVGAGANCEQAQCASNLQCTYVETATGYFAECKPRAQAGEPCNEVGCDDGLGCGPQGLCTPLGALGARCDYVGCIDGLLCNYDIQTCAEPPEAGQPCLQGECARGAFCDTPVDVSICTPTLPLATACTGHRQCDSGFCPAGFCDLRPALGESCAGSFVCELGASCDGEVCRPSVTQGPAVCFYEGW